MDSSRVLICTEHSHCKHWSEHYLLWWIFSHLSRYENDSHSVKHRLNTWLPSIFVHVLPGVEISYAASRGKNIETSEKAKKTHQAKSWMFCAICESNETTSHLQRGIHQTMLLVHFVLTKSWRDSKWSGSYQHLRHIYGLFMCLKRHKIERQHRLFLSIGIFHLHIWHRPKAVLI